MSETFFIPLFGLLFLLPLGWYAFSVYCWYRIMQKAGYDNLGLIAILPFLDIVLIVILAFSQWHALKGPPVNALTPETQPRA